MCVKEEEYEEESCNPGNIFLGDVFLVPIWIVIIHLHYILYSVLKLPVGIYFEDVEYTYIHL